MKNNVKQYKIKDFYGACVLRTLGFEIQELDRTPHDFVNFVFLDPDQKAKKVLSDYWNHNIQVDARAMVEAINELKTRLYSRT